MITATTSSDARSEQLAVNRLLLTVIGMTLAGAFGYAAVYDGMGVVAACGIPILLAACGAVAIAPRLARRWLLPVLGMAMVAVLIHAARGRQEAHFAVFVMLAVLLALRDWVPIVVGAAAIAVHHLSFNYLQTWGWGPICFTEPGLGRTVEHAVYVVVEAAALVLLAVRSRSEFESASEVAGMVERIVDQQGRIDLSGAQVQASTPLGRRFSAVLGDLATTVTTLQRASASIDEASHLIATGSSDLSLRTDQQASSLQRAASEMQQLTETVEHSAQRARQASDLATDATCVAENGGQVIGQATASMQNIGESAGRIAEITAVIDGIAFQTNILALNAAVEAARAGEQGRGFAVVAAEVRSLAQRSADSARQIRTLIEESVARVRTGAMEVVEAGRTMERIVGASRQVSGLLSDISTAMSEQAQGLRQLSAAVTQIDAATHQNAAVVGQSASAASSMRQQAEQLAQAVTVFRPV